MCVYQGAEYDGKQVTQVRQQAGARINQQTLGEVTEWVCLRVVEPAYWVVDEGVWEQVWGQLYNESKQRRTQHERG